MDTIVINIFWMMKLKLVIKSESIISEPVDDCISLPLVGLGESAHCTEGAPQRCPWAELWPCGETQQGETETYHSVCGKQTQ